MWDGIGDFLAMGGHGPWIWGSYGAALVLFLAEILLLARRRQRAYRMIRRRARAVSGSGPSMHEGGSA